MKTRDSCKPEETIEPSSVDFVKNEDEDTRVNDTILGSEPEDKPRKMFLPVKERKRSRKYDLVCEAIQLMKTVIENYPTKDLINFMKEDIQKAREHELKLFQMMLSQGNRQESPKVHNPISSHNYCHPHTVVADHGNWYN